VWDGRPVCSRRDVLRPRGGQTVTEVYARRFVSFRGWRVRSSERSGRLGVYSAEKRPLRVRLVRERLGNLDIDRWGMREGVRWRFVRCRDG
jgi:hypothetical protein